MNLGNGAGFSVLQVVDTARRVTGKRIDYQVMPRRPGDPPVLVASATKAHTDLGWRPQFDTLESIVETAWTWHRNRAARE
jgi:UDP-glucose 4-epimerase